MSEAVEHYKNAVEKGKNTFAMNRLGKIYEEGKN